MKQYEDIPNSNGMKVLHNVVDIETGKTSAIILRNITEPFWSAVINATQEYRICALGTPGIGKTVIIPILIRLLIKNIMKEKQNATVIFNVQTVENDAFVYIFTYSSVDGTINADVIPQRSFCFNDYNDEFTYYVVDPGKTKDSCDPSQDFIGKVIIVASPDGRHWGEDEFTKNRQNTKGSFRYFPVWCLEELQVAKHYFNTNLSNEEIERRYDLVGGVPRVIFSKPHEFSDHLKIQDVAVQALTEAQINWMMKTIRKKRQ
jgi:hypothetical protein